MPRYTTDAGPWDSSKLGANPLTPPGQRFLEPVPHPSTHFVYLRASPLMLKLALSCYFLPSLWR